MDNYDVTIDGVSGKSIGLDFAFPFELNGPKPRVTKERIPGRNGDILICDGTYENREGYLPGCMYRNSNIKSGFNALNKWLFDKPGYRKLITSDDPTHYLMARVANGADVRARADKVAPFEIKFDCKPQRFLKSGDATSSTTSGGLVFNNPTGFDARPLIRIEYEVTGQTTYITINDDIRINISLLKMANFGTMMYFDTDIDTVYNDYNGGTCYDDVVSYNAPVVLKPGENRIQFFGDIKKITVTPRWWEL